jgi:glycosyltransferase involved in cell wall biosynthesis
VIVGYGSFARELKALAYTTQTKNPEAALRIARDSSLDALAAFLGSVREPYWERAAAVPIEFAGRLEHGPLSATLPTWDVLVVPSEIPEAFGMVAAEAAACGVLPVVPRHSGIGEAGAALERALDVPGLLTFEPDDPINGIAERVDAVLSLPYEERRALELAAAELARREWSWETVASRLLEVATR